MADSLSLAGWRRTLLADGVHLVSPKGSAHGAVRIRTRESPWIPISGLKDRLRAQLPQATDVAFDAVERCETLEGEYAAILPMRWSLGAVATDRTIGLVFGDDFYASIDGTTSTPDVVDGMRGAVRVLTDRYSLGLGTDRRRPFEYVPSAGWQGVRIHHGVVWMVPGFPRRYGSITVFDVRVVSSSPESMQDRSLFEEVPQDLLAGRPQPPVALATKGGLRGQQTTIRGRLPSGVPRILDHVALTDGHYLYVMRLESDEVHLAEHRAAFAQVVDTVRPLPMRVAIPATSAQWS